MRAALRLAIGHILEYQLSSFFVVVVGGGRGEAKHADEMRVVARQPLVYLEFTLELLAHEHLVPEACHGVRRLFDPATAE